MMSALGTDVKVLIADDHGIVRSGLRMLLEQQSDIEVVAEASDGAMARDLAIRERPGCRPRGRSASRPRTCPF